MQTILHFVHRFVKGDMQNFLQMTRVAWFLGKRSFPAIALPIVFGPLDRETRWYKK